ncbi:hypothetical protein BGZ65_004632 [Modicella reniformis]|uniref:Uncharacterized protein n=1 Tax=Modicella reniformis TaxID=1440133 RepID=A0A9P6SLJ0_9FUNG|nr:hypothetical protein BGZ65_004632 [Modicella reniformis]
MQRKLPMKKGWSMMRKETIEDEVDDNDNDDGEWNSDIDEAEGDICEALNVDDMLRAEEAAYGQAILKSSGKEEDDDENEEGDSNNAEEEEEYNEEKEYEETVDEDPKALGEGIDKQQEQKG